VVTVVVAIIGALGAIGAAVVGVINRAKINEIHVLVNSRLDAALGQVDDLKEQRDRTQRKEDESASALRGPRGRERDSGSDSGTAGTTEQGPDQVQGPRPGDRPASRVGGESWL
jgi:hypothetical protein